MPSVTDPENDIQDSPDVSHLDAARKYFEADDHSANPPPSDDPNKGNQQQQQQQQTPDKRTSVPDPLSLLKGGNKGGDSAGDDKQNQQAPTDEPVDKGLQAPPENAKSRAGWDELKKRATEFRTRAASLEQENAALKKQLEEHGKSAPVDEATKARLAELEQQNKIFSDRLKVLDLRSHPEFEQKFIVPQNAAKQAIAAILQTEEVDATVDELLSLKGRKFNEAVSDVLEKLTPFARVKFQAQLDKFIEAQAGADAALAEADEFLKNARQHGAAKNRAIFDQVGAKFKDTFVPATIDDKASDAEKAELEKYNRALASVQKRAEQYGLGQIDEPTAAEIAHKAALYDFMLEAGLPRVGAVYGQVIDAQSAEIAALKKQVEELTAAAPKPPGSSSAVDTPPENESHFDAAKRYLPA